jgi:hypothetical protein
LRQVGGFLWVLRFPQPIRLPGYNWNIVESGVTPSNKLNPNTMWSSSCVQEVYFFKVNNMKYWHPHLPFGQHISVSTLVNNNKKKLGYLILLTLKK